MFCRNKCSLEGCSTLVNGRLETKVLLLVASFVLQISKNYGFTKNVLKRRKMLSGNLLIFNWFEKHQLFDNIFLLSFAAIMFILKSLPEIMFSSKAGIAMTNFKFVKIGAGSFLAGTAIAKWKRFVTNWGSFCYYKSGLWLWQYGTTLALTILNRVASRAGCYKTMNNNC